MIFTKAPVPGRVKTRLRLAPDVAARMHTAFIRDVVHRHRAPQRQTTLWVTGETSHSLWTSLDVPVHAQIGEDLGARLRHAFEQTLRAGRPVVVLGTDSPTLPPAYIHDAFARLNTVDAVVGPAFDGGYYCLGMTKMVPELLPADMPWGTEQVLERTLNAARDAGCSISLLPFWYDVDRPADLDMMKGHLATLAAAGITLPDATIACLRELADDDNI
ncbi:MAG: TIGR04282 family arsenosugar biosynthesis glycosyltransferase [Myxococcota bacterium]|nr:TIGR04282 family arsenosugar biosynthesis glycosyltransferase [Myxococcota bacterium]